jgi:hypothetical protein
MPWIVDIHQELCVRKAGYPGDLHLPVLLPTGMINPTKSYTSEFAKILVYLIGIVGYEINF